MSDFVVILSKCAPIPISGYTQGSIWHFRRTVLPAGGRGGDNWAGGCRRTAVTVLSRRIARRLTVGATAPGLEFGVAMGTRSARCPSWVVVCVLVEGNLIRRVPVAEDIAAASTMVAADEVAKVTLACRLVADSGFLVGLLQTIELVLDSSMTTSGK